MNNMWLSKDDVIKDLAECNGDWTDVDDEYIVRGSKPPPPSKVIEDNEEEMNLRFGGYGDHLGSPNDDSGPDLEGITKMLRMVDSFAPEDASKCSTLKSGSSASKPKPEEDTIVISKLNPHVKEFVPKSMLTVAENRHKINKENVGIVPITPPVASNTIEDGGGPCSSVDFLQNKEHPVAEEEKQKVVALLKSKISTASKEDSFKTKREKNVAMAALLRLNAGPPRAPSTSSVSPQPTTKPLKQPPVLFTPDYFAGPSRTPIEVNVEDTEVTIPEPTPLLETTVQSSSPRETNDPHIKESIEKVHNWLNSPEKKAKSKAPVPYIGPVTFRRKETTSPRSPSSEVSKRSEPGHMIPAFVPSQYATELAKDLEARVKAKKEEEKKKLPPQDMWSKLESDLKARDETIRNRREQPDNEASRSPAKNSSSSSRHK